MALKIMKTNEKYNEKNNEKNNEKWWKNNEKNNENNLPHKSHYCSLFEEEENDE